MREQANALSITDSARNGGISCLLGTGNFAAPLAQCYGYALCIFRTLRRRAQRKVIVQNLLGASRGAVQVVPYASLGAAQFTADSSSSCANATKQ